MDTVTATGGFCAPFSPTYDLFAPLVIPGTLRGLSDLWIDRADEQRTMATFYKARGKKKKANDCLIRAGLWDLFGFRMFSERFFSIVYHESESPAWILEEKPDKATRRQCEVRRAVARQAIEEYDKCLDGGGVIHPVHPISKALPVMSAPRGGIRFANPPREI